MFVWPGLQLVGFLGLAVLEVSTIQLNFQLGGGWNTFESNQRVLFCDYALDLHK